VVWRRLALGPWTCFDEFNRINSEVLLSVIAEQIYIVQQAVAAGVATFEFVGQTVPINPRVGNSLSSISFETNSELTRIESCAFYCSSRAE
jgi:hypothetical protein